MNKRSLRSIVMTCSALLLMVSNPVRSDPTVLTSGQLDTVTAGATDADAVSSALALGDFALATTSADALTFHYAGNSPLQDTFQAVANATAVTLQLGGASSTSTATDVSVEGNASQTFTIQAHVAVLGGEISVATQSAYGFYVIKSFWIP